MAVTEESCVLVPDQAGPLRCWCFLWLGVAGRTCSCLYKPLPNPTQLSPEEPVSMCQLCPDTHQRYFGMKSRSVEVVTTPQKPGKQTQSTSLYLQPLSSLPKVSSTCKSGCNTQSCAEQDLKKAPLQTKLHSVKQTLRIVALCGLTTVKLTESWF